MNSSQFIISQIIDADMQGELLTAEMYSICVRNGNCLPEELPEEDADKYNALYKQRAYINQLLARMLSIADSYAKFALADLH